MRIVKADNTNTIMKNIIDEVCKKSCDLGQDIIVFVPEKYSLTMEKSLLINSNSKAITNVFVLTPSRLLHRLVKDENNYIRVYDAVTPEEIVTHLYENGIIISEIKTDKIGLEEYYIDLMNEKEGR